MFRVLPEDMGYYLPGTAIDSVTDTHFTSSVYVVVRGRECGIVDAGVGTQTFRALVGCLSGRRLTPRWLVLTHDHYDHVGNAAQIRRHYNVPVMIHAADRPLVEQPLRIFDDRAMTSRYCGTVRGAFDEMNRSDAQYCHYQRRVSEDQYHPVAVDGTVEDGDMLEVSDLTLQVLHTPGHSPGSVTMYAASHGAVYAGDLPLWLGPGRPHPLGDYSSWMKSMQRLLALNPRFIGWGHSVPTVGGRNCRRFLRSITERASCTRKAIEEVLAQQELTISGLFTEIGLIPEEHREMGEYSIHAILSALREDGRVEAVRTGGTLYWRSR